MPKKFTYFEQHQSGIYSADCAAEGRIGTEHVGPCVAFFLYDIPHKKALVIHLDQGSSILTVNREINELLGDSYNPDNYQAFLVGGWEASLKIDIPDNTANETIKLLRLKGIKKIEQRLYKLDGVAGIQDPQHFYEMICLDLNTGKLAIAKKKGHDFLRVDDYSTEDKKLRGDCLQYAFKRGMLPGLKATLDYFEKLMEGNEHSVTDDANSFYEAIIKDNDGSPFIPSLGLREKSDEQLLAIAVAANKADIIGFFKLLYTNFVNPVSALQGKEGNTALHYATAKLNREPNNYALRAIVLLMILRGERDLNNHKGKNALSYLKSEELKNLKSVCEEILEIYPKLFMNINVQGQVIMITQIAIKELVNRALLIAKDPGNSSAYDSMQETVQDVVSRARVLLSECRPNPVRRGLTFS